MDWNIFFSTVSQTSGAIIGIFSAFIITKIVNNETEYKKNYLQLMRYIANSYKLVNEAHHIAFNWYNRRKFEDALEDIKYELKHNPEVEKDSAINYYKRFNFSRYENRKNVIDNIEKEIPRLLKEAREPSPPPWETIKPIATQIRNDLSNEGEKIDDLYIKINHQILLVNNFSGFLKQQTESSRLISISIIFTLILFYTGVIYPLSFLPVETNNINLSFIAFFDILFSLRGLMLFILSSIFTGLMIVFFIRNNNLIYDKKDIDKLNEYSNIANYSTYLKKFEENIEFLAEEENDTSPH